MPIIPGFQAKIRKFCAPSWKSGRKPIIPGIIFKKPHGKGACPFNSLFWDFHHRHRPLLEKNARIGMMYRTWDKKADAEKDNILAQAALYRETLETL